MLLGPTRRDGWYLGLVIASMLARGWSAVCKLWIFVVLKRASHTLSAASASFSRSEKP